MKDTALVSHRHECIPVVYIYIVLGYFSLHFRRIEDDFSDVNGFTEQLKFL